MFSEQEATLHNVPVSLKVMLRDMPISSRLWFFGKTPRWFDRFYEDDTDFRILVLGKAPWVVEIVYVFVDYQNMILLLLFSH